jgi:NCS1 family nucleobase:cation symporter-1
MELNKPMVPINKNTAIAKELLPKTANDRSVGIFGYMSMWLGDGFNIGNITLGSSIVVAGVATTNLVQTAVAAAVAILIISIIFALNDRFGYVTGSPYVMQLRLAFGKKGAKYASLLRGIPAVVWFGFQSWTGALALNQVLSIVFGFENVVACFVLLQVIQIALALKGFQSIKIVSSIISLVVMVSLSAVFVLLITQHQAAISTNLVHQHGTWGLPFFGLIVAFLGNYTAIFESAADYSRELVTGISDKKRCFLYFLPISIAYGITLLTGAMLAAVTGISSPVNAMAQLFNNNAITVAVSLFIVLGVITTNLVANIIPPIYVLTSIFNLKQKHATVIIGLLAIVTCPWLLVQDSSSAGLALFIKLYSIFLGPMTAVILLEFYAVRKQVVDLKKLYDEKAQPNYRKKAIAALLIGAVFASIQVDLAWLIGFGVSFVIYLILNRQEIKQPSEILN